MIKLNYKTNVELIWTWIDKSPFRGYYICGDLILKDISSCEDMKENWCIFYGKKKIYGGTWSWDSLGSAKKSAPNLPIVKHALTSRIKIRHRI